MKNNQSGLSFIEVVISMAILGIIVIVFLTLFTSSLVWIYAAGDKGEAYSDAQSDIETRLGTQETIANPNLNITFPSGTYNIQGGLVETYQTVGQRDSTIETFLPLVPTVTISPMIQSEGVSSTEITVTGLNTSFDGTSFITIYDKEGTTQIGSILYPSSLDTTNQIMIFSMPSGLINAQGDYIIKYTTDKTPDEIVRAKFTVAQPKFLAVGNNSVYISPDGMNWVKRSNYVDFPAFTALTDVIYSGNRYIGVGFNGLVLVSRDQQPWTTRSVGGENLKSITWSSAFNKFYSVGAEGGIYSSENGLNWSTLSSGISEQLNEIHFTPFLSGTNLLTAVGNDGNILNSTNGYSWSITNVGTENINGVTSGNVSSEYRIVAVGDAGQVYISMDGYNWSSYTPVATNLNDVAFNYSNGLFVAVGDSGLVMTSSDGINWTTRNSSGQNLYGVHTLGNDYIAVGDNRFILNSTNGISWSALSTISGENLTSISGR